jgi:hypothetical protein
MEQDEAYYNPERIAQIVGRCDDERDWFWSGKSRTVRELVTNMTPLRKKIIRLFGPTACTMHGLNPESTF